MSEYRYNLSLHSGDETELNETIGYLQKNKIIPDLLEIDAFFKSPDRGSYMAFLSTENIMPYGTVRCWEGKEHEAFFNALSKKVPGVTFELTGEDIDDPNNSVFKKAFQNGRYKEVYQEKQDLDSLLASKEWQKYGEPEASVDDHSIDPLDYRKCVADACVAIERALAALDQAVAGGENIHSSVINHIITAQLTLSEAVQQMASGNEEPKNHLSLAEKISQAEEKASSSCIQPQPDEITVLRP